MVSNLLATASTAAPLLEDEAANFDILSFMQNLAGYLKNIGHVFMIVIGVVLVIVAVVQIAKGFASGGRGQVNWVMSIACLLVGGLLIFGGWNTATWIASVGNGTIDQIATGSYAEAIGEYGGDTDTNGQS